MKQAEFLAGSFHRRNLLIAGAAGLAARWPIGEAKAHASFGPVNPPEPIPNLMVTSVDGKPIEMNRLLTGGITAVQLMFTGCTATCPIQGAIFADAQKHLARADSKLRLLSVSVDPLGDDAKALRDWLGRFGAQPQRWLAVVPRMRDVDRLLDFLRGRASGVDRHTAQAFLFNPKAQLAYRTADMPAGPDVVSLMRQLASMY
jgi:protein SCO1